MTRVRSAIVAGRVETRVAIGAIRYGQRRNTRRMISLIVGLLLFLLGLAVLLVRPAHGAAREQVVCVLGGAQAICPPSLEIGNPPTYTVFVHLPIVARNK